MAEMSYCYESSSGSKFWFKTKEESDKGYGKFHREDGPAVESLDGYKSWYIDDKLLTEQEFDEWRKQKVLKEAIRGWL